MREVEHPSPHAVVLRLEVPDRVDHWPGQHYVIKLSADDGYTAQRSYSVASDPADPLLEFYVERLDDGEVSGFLADVVEPGDELEIRGPIGGWFVWTAGGPVLGIGGGSGVVPIVSVLRHAQRIGRTDLTRFAVAARTHDELPYADEFAAAGATIALSRRGPARPARRPHHGRRARRGRTARGQHPGVRFGGVHRCRDLDAHRARGRRAPHPHRELRARAPDGSPGRSPAARGVG